MEYLNENELAVELPANNPQVDEFKNLEIDLNAIKGDQIGQTLYCERFVLRTLLSLKNVDWSQEYETNLSTLWDMTTEIDVVKYLIQHEFPSIAIAVISDNLWNRRLTEILVGIIANLCCFTEGRRACIENADVLEYLTSLIAYRDNKTLLQLMRCYYSICPERGSSLFDAIEKHGTFMHQLAFIIRNTKYYDLFHAVINFLACLSDVKTDGSDTFACPPLIKSLAHHYKNIYSRFLNSHDVQAVLDYSKVFLRLTVTLAKLNQHMNLTSTYKKFIRYYTLLLVYYKTHSYNLGQLNILMDIYAFIHIRKFFSKRFLISLLNMVEPYKATNTELLFHIHRCINTTVQFSSDKKFLVYFNKNKKNPLFELLTEILNINGLFPNNAEKRKLICATYLNNCNSDVVGGNQS